MVQLSLVALDILGVMKRRWPTGLTGQAGEISEGNRELSPCVLPNLIRPAAALADGIGQVMEHGDRLLKG